MGLCLSTYSLPTVSLYFYHHVPMAITSSHHTNSSPSHVSSARDVGDPSGDRLGLRSLFDAALEAYQGQTGMNLSDHCNSVDSITTLLQEQARAFGESQDDHGRMVKSLKLVVPVLSALSSTLVNVNLVRRVMPMGIPSS